MVPFPSDSDPGMEIPPRLSPLRLPSPTVEPVNITTDRNVATSASQSLPASATVSPGPQSSSSEASNQASHRPSPHDFRPHTAAGNASTAGENVTSVSPRCPWLPFLP